MAEIAKKGKDVEIVLETGETIIDANLYLEKAKLNTSVIVKVEATTTDMSSGWVKGKIYEMIHIETAKIIEKAGKGKIIKD